MDADIISLGSENRKAVRTLADALGLPVLESGWVWLAGAGPGDPGLVGLHTLSALIDADVILTDALVNQGLLKLARPDAQILHVGKRGGHRSPSQKTISAQLVAYARRGRKVLRLKGGDPFVFGRGGEEAAALVRAGVPFRVVPGVTAGIGGLAYAGIPVTHRDTNQGVTFLTGQGAGGQLPDFDWDAIARGSPAIVIYMGRKHAAEIAARLMRAGRNPREPAAIVSNASLAHQTVRVTDLSGLGAACAEADAPAILVIGENVRLAAVLDWVGAPARRTLGLDPLTAESMRETG